MAYHFPSPALITSVLLLGTALPTFAFIGVAAESSSSIVVSSSTSSTSSISPPASTPTLALPSSVDGSCGATSGQTCLGSVFGACCSGYGFCGATDLYCLTTEGCQAGYGECTTPSQVSSSAAPAPTAGGVSVDGSCGGVNAWVCPGSGLGDCCSPYGYCGSSNAHCGAGCQIAFGSCSGPTRTGTAPLPTSTLRVSLDGACGRATGQTCDGSSFGDCCSEFGFCGGEAAYCTGACQPTFGTCKTTPAKRETPKGNLRAASFAAEKRSTE